MGDWLTILIILLILGILLDGWRRMRNAQRDSLKVSRFMGRASSTTSHRDPAVDYGAELPNGGARVVAYRETPEDERPFHRAPVDELDDDTHIEDSGQSFDTETFETEEPEPPRYEARPADSRGRIPEQVALNLDESVPLLMEAEESASPASGEHDARIEPTLDGGGEWDETPEPSAAPEPAPEPARTKATSSPLEPRGAQPSPAPFKSEPQAKPEPGLKPESKPRPESKPKPKAEPKPEAGRPAPQPEEVLVINVMAPAGEQFRGDALLDAVIDAGLRFGDMNIFHRYERPRGGGAILFSLANMVKPGVFDLDAMDNFTTPGISLFMTLPLERAVELANVDVFEEMLEAARSIGQALGGELKDENRSVLTRQTQEHCRQRIHEFERKQLSRAPH
ncbi:cell division protein ZipA [Marinimicrobium sp. ARAG 43.8]|uniref:cell division protein ZipA n=1 Tax=Marinimicrobium sp. ARAG 43.8 TaxID=3418719 RepID=UPI003CF536C4